MVVPVQVLGRRHGGVNARGEAGVGEAPRHEVAGGEAPMVQRAPYRENRTSVVFLQVNGL